MGTSILLILVVIGISIAPLSIILTTGSISVSTVDALCSPGMLERNADCNLTYVTPACQSGGADSTFCNEADLFALQVIGARCGAGNCTAEEQNFVNKLQGATVAPTTCNKWSDFFFNFLTCGGRQIAVWIGSILIWLTGWLLGTAGILFNWVIDYTIAQQMYTSIQDGVNTGWSAFRDFSNIVIIGMFTFIAISMILGIESFGAKRMVARVLIIAVLINFSLLFTRIIIESSNFVARQFYNAASLQATPTGNVTGVSSGTAPVQSQFAAGISGRFAQLMGVASFGDSKDALWKISEKTDNGFIALLQGLLTATVFIAAALTFLYGAFLLIARAILFIFLLVVSALAFASYLIPKWGDQYWSMWWESLLRNAIFAPLLFLMLWATLEVGGALAVTGSQGSLGGLLADPAKAGNINALFSYLIILGMLYASIKFASSFSTKIAGFGTASLGTSAALVFGSKIAGFAGRNLIGRGAAALQRGTQGDLSEARREAARLDSALQLDKKFNKLSPSELRKRERGVLDANRKAQNLAKDANLYGAISKGTFDAAGTKLGGKVLKALGADALAGGKAESFGARSDRIAKEASKKAESLALSDSDKSTMRDQMHDDQKNAKEQLEVAKKTLEEIRKTPEHQTQNAIKSAAEQELKAIGKKAENDIQGMVKRGESEESIKQRIADRNTALKMQTTKIEEAHSKITALEQKGGVLKDFEAAAKKASSLSDKAIEETIKSSSDSANKAGADAAANFAAGWWGSADSTIANNARDVFNKNRKTATRRDFAKWLREAENGDKSGGKGKGGEDKDEKGH